MTNNVLAGHSTAWWFTGRQAFGHLLKPPLQVRARLHLAILDGNRVWGGSVLPFRARNCVDFGAPITPLFHGHGRFNPIQNNERWHPGRLDTFC
jgi:hypothetical protein